MNKLVRVTGAPVKQAQQADAAITQSVLLFKCLPLIGHRYPLNVNGVANGFLLPEVPMCKECQACSHEAASSPKQATQCSCHLVHQPSVNQHKSMSVKLSVTVYAVAPLAAGMRAQPCYETL